MCKGKETKINRIYLFVKCKQFAGGKVGRMSDNSEEENKGLNMDSLDVTRKSLCFIPHQETRSLKRAMSSNL